MLKLDWYRQGDGISERQWRDIAGIIKVRGALLDQAYLTEWAQELGLSDVLTRALAESDCSK